MVIWIGVGNIVPLDAITDLAPAVGYADDLGVLVLAIAAVSRYINDDVRAKARGKIADWFGDDVRSQDSKDKAG